MKSCSAVALSWQQQGRIHGRNFAVPTRLTVVAAITVPIAREAVPSQI